MAVELRAPDRAGRGRPIRSPDAELARRARDGDSDAFAELARRYRPMMSRAISEFFAPGEDRDDFVQVALIGLHSAVRTYREDAGPFSVHAQMCVRRKLVMHIKQSLRRKHGPLNDALSLFGPASRSHQEQLISEVRDHSAAPPEDMAIASAMRYEIDRIARNALSGMERQALFLLAGGASYEEIRATLRCNLKSVDNATQRARQKLARALRLAGWDVPPPQGKRRPMEPVPNPPQGARLTAPARESPGIHSGG